MKNRLRRNMSIILEVILTFSCFLISVSAANDPTISVQSVTAQAGETVDVDILLSNNPGIVSMILGVSFDSSILTLTEVTDKGILGSNSHKPELVSSYTLSWANDTATQNYMINDSIVTLTFSVSDDAEPGDYPITISYDNDNYDIYDKDLETVDFKLENGTITIPQPATESPTEPSTEAPTILDDSPAITVQSITAQAGETADVDIIIRNNPGIVSMALGVTFDSNVLTLTEVTDKGVLGSNSHKPELVSPYTLSWANDTATQNYVINGSIVTLSFSVNENVGSGVYPVEISYDNDNYDIYDKDLETVDFRLENGAVTVIEKTPDENYIIGDADDDGEVSILDATAIQRKLASFTVSNFNAKAACVTGNDLSILDATAIQRWLANYTDPYHIGDTIS